ncbi:MAG: AAA family ATPase [Alphaproteobacteria bacterium]|nr:AAA family ATPase [Alphaproteobacteria bacterium]
MYVSGLFRVGFRSVWLWTATAYLCNLHGVLYGIGELFVVSVTGLGPIADAAGIFALGTGAGFFTRHILRRIIDGDLIECQWKRQELDDGLKAATGELGEIRPQLISLNKLRDALTGEEDELWRLHAVEMPPAIASALAQNLPKIVTVMHLKGGVGKTTTVANLAAHFGKKGKRVLAIDLDYQGSLSRMLMLAANIRNKDDPRAINLLSGDQDFAALQRQVISLHPTLENVDLISCGQTFDRFENRLMLRWLIGDETDDVRYRLASALTSQPFRDSYDLILIDAPPRLSTGAINALASSQVVLIPTVLDRLSAEAVGNFISRLNHFRPMNPALQYAGVIGTLRGQIGGADVKEGAFEIAQ